MSKYDKMIEVNREVAKKRLFQPRNPFTKIHFTNGFIIKYRYLNCNWQTVKRKTER